MRFFFATVGLHNPSLAMALPEHMAYPISQEVEDGVDLDYTALLLGSEFVIDKTAYEDILSGARRFLIPMARTLKKLREAKILQTVDMGSMIRAKRTQILSKADVLCSRAEAWLDDLRKQWGRVKNEFKAFQRKFGSESLQSQNEGHFGVENWLAEIGEQGNDELRRAALRLLEGRKTRLCAGEREMLRGILKFVLNQVVCTDFLRCSLKAPFLNWDDAQPYYDRLYATRWDVEEGEAALIHQARLLFDVVIPELKPNRIEEVIRFIKDDKAVESMRAELFGRIEAGEDVSRTWFGQYVNEVFRKELARQGRVRKFRWLGSTIGVVLPGASLVQEIAAEVGLAAAETAIGATGRSCHWYYALQKAVSVRGIA